VLQEIIFRFVIGGLVVSAFAFVGDLLRPKSFAGLFAAAPSVALATLALTFRKEGAAFAAVEGRSMIAGAVGLATYSFIVCRLLASGKAAALKATTASMPVWFGAAFLLWFAMGR
jgi:Protein of unknown function (DUF3147)